MATLDIKIPQMGEGLTEVRLLQFLKSPGESVRRDELIYTMETDKATLEVESPESGTLIEWLAVEGDVLPIGAAVARIQSTDVSVVTPLPSDSPQPASVEPRALDSERIIPPRTRAYAREHGVSDDALARMPSVTTRLMPSDIDAHLASLGGVQTPTLTTIETDTHHFHDLPLSERQRKLNFHMKRSAQTVIPGTISRPIEWSDIREHAVSWRDEASAIRPTEFQTFAYCVVQAVRTCPKFRCSVIREDTIRRYENLNLGIAVALPDGELTTAVVPNADSLPYTQFIQTLQERIKSARTGEDQADATVQMLLSYLGANGIRDAVPVLVAPAVAVMFIGDAYSQSQQLLANVALTFDHRLINGVEAAELLNAIAQQVQQFNATDRVWG